MEVEKIISTILEKVGKTDVTSKTIQSIIDSFPLPEGQEPDDAYFDNMVGIAKSIQGNVNHVFSEKLSAEVERKLEEAKKHEPQPQPEKPQDRPGNTKGDEDRLLALEKELSEMKAERDAERQKAAHDSTLRSVRKGLEDKFSKAGLKVNDFFMQTAMSKLDIPEKGADVNELIGKAEALYNADMKAAGVVDAKPNAGNHGPVHEEDTTHEFDDVAKRVHPGQS